MEKTAVVILNWNGRNFLEKFLPSVISNTQDATIYVADNASSDDSVSFLKNNFPQVKLIINSYNAGFSEGYNLALKQVKATYYVLLNSDVEVTPNWLNPLIGFMDNHPEVGACQPKIKSYSERNHFEYAGAAGGFIDKLGYPFCRGRIFETIEEDKGQYNDLKEVFWATGACMVVRSKAFHEAGELDKDFFAHMEEIDLCWRMQRLGWKIFFCGNSEVFHVGGGSLNKSNPRKTYLNFRNSIALLVKNHSAQNFYKILFLRLVMDGIAGFKFLLSSGPNHCWAVIKAHFYLYKHAIELRKKRLAINTVNQKIHGIYPHSIAVEYFIKGKKKFEDLNFNPKNN